MGGAVFIGSLTLGAALLSLWLDVRLAALRPDSLFRRFVHAAVACLLLQAVVGVVAALGGSEAPATQRLLTLFLLLLPGLVYVFLSGLWLVRTLAEATR
jgi:hypothetical protein